MTHHEQIKYLGLDKLNALDKLNVLLHGQFQITGSLSLFEYGVIKREIGDIDIVVNSLEGIKSIFDKKEYSFHEWFDYSDNLENPNNTLQGKGKVTNRVSFKIGEVKCCAFFADNQDFKVFDYMLDRRFKVSNPIYSIQAKKRYVTDLYALGSLNYFQVNKLRKHNADIQAFYDKKKNRVINNLIQITK